MSQINTTDTCLHPAASGKSLCDAVQEHENRQDFSTDAFVGNLDARQEDFFRRKYLVDRCVGGALLVATSPVTLSLFLIVKATSRGPGFYRQERVGLNGKSFDIIKLRSMVRDAEKPGQAVWCTKNDARVTRVGKVLRKLHLDELPQLWNVAKGEMSLVGPRPERPKICEDLAEEIDGYYRRNSVKPGVTGLAQVNLPPDETVEDVRRKQILDLRYIQEANHWLDTRMVLATAFRMTGLKGVRVVKAMRLCRRDHLHSCCNGSSLPVREESSHSVHAEPELAGAMSGASDSMRSESYQRRPR